MAEYEVGYQKPPRHSKFKPGNCANPYGRHGKKKRPTEAEIFDAVLSGFVNYREGGKSKRASRIELLIKNYGTKALKGDVRAAAHLLKLREIFKALPDVAEIVIPMTEQDMRAA